MVEWTHAGWPSRSRWRRPPPASAPSCRRRPSPASPPLCRRRLPLPRPRPRWCWSTMGSDGHLGSKASSTGTSMLIEALLPWRRPCCWDWLRPPRHQSCQHVIVLLANHPPRAIPEGGDGETGEMALAMATPVGVKAGGLLVGQDFVGGGRQLKWQVILLKRKNAHWTREKQGKVMSLHIRNQGFGDNGPFSFAATLVFQLKHISPKLPNYFILVPVVFICHNRRPTIKCL